MSSPKGAQNPPSKPVPARELSYRLEKANREVCGQEHDGKHRQSDQTEDLSTAESIESKATISTSPKSSLAKAVPTSSALQIYLTQEVAFDWRLNAQCYILTLATGVLDITTYNAFTVFATKMTGNFLLLAIDAVDNTKLSGDLSQNAATAIGSFILGAVLFGHIGRIVGRRRRIYLITTNIIQTSLIFAATSIQYFCPMEKIGPLAIIKLALLGFAMAGQVSLAIGVGLAELNTTMITAAIIQICYDPRLFQPNNAPRTRRLAFVLTMVIGHFIGAVASRYSIAMGMLLTGIIKGVVTLSFLANPGLVLTPCGNLEDGSPRSDGTVTPAMQVLWGD